MSDICKPTYSGEERRIEDLANKARMSEMHEQNSARFASIEQQQEEMRLELKRNTDATQRIENGVGTLIDILEGGRRSMRMGIKFGKWLSLFARWALPIFGLGSAIWAIAHGHVPWRE